MFWANFIPVTQNPHLNLSILLQFQVKLLWNYHETCKKFNVLLMTTVFVFKNNLIITNSTWRQHLYLHPKLLCSLHVFCNFKWNFGETYKFHFNRVARVASSKLFRFETTLFQFHTLQVLTQIPRSNLYNSAHNSQETCKLIQLLLERIESCFHSRNHFYSTCTMLHSKLCCNTARFVVVVVVKKHLAML